MNAPHTPAYFLPLVFFFQQAETERNQQTFALAFSQPTNVENHFALWKNPSHAACSATAR